MSNELLKISPELVAGGLVVLGMVSWAVNFAKKWWDNKTYGDPNEIVSVGPTGVAPLIK